jgi:hypothetical protein
MYAQIMRMIKLNNFILGQQNTSMPPKHGKRTQQGKQEPAWKPSVVCRSAGPITWFHESGYSHITDSIPICKEFLKSSSSGLHNLQTPFQIVNWVPEENNHGVITIEENGVQQTYNAYKKVIPLIDPYKWAKNEVRIKKEEIIGDWSFAPGILQQTYRKGYIDGLASYLVGNYASAHENPHFLKYFGSFRALSEKYMYDLKDDFESMRFTRWFWESIQNEIKTKSSNYLNQKTNSWKMTIMKVTKKNPRAMRRAVPFRP